MNDIDYFLSERLDRYALLVGVFVLAIILTLLPDKVNKTFIQPLPVEASGYDLPNLRLEGRSSVLSEINSLKKKLEELDERQRSNLEEITRQIEVTAKSERRLTPQEREEVISRFRDTLSQDILPASIDSLAEHHARSVAEGLRQSSLARLGNQLEVLGARANRTLAIGIMFAVVGLFTLYATFFMINPIDSIFYEPEPSQASHPWLKFVESYLPRLTLVLIIEIVSFYFLRLYSKMLAEMRYVQNEVTNVELKLIALAHAATISEKDSLKEVISVLSTTERNSVIEKTQTTVDIERDRASSEADSNSIKAMAELLHGNEKGWFWKKRE